MNFKFLFNFWKFVIFCIAYFVYCTTFLKFVFVYGRLIFHILSWPQHLSTWYYLTNLKPGDKINGKFTIWTIKKMKTNMNSGHSSGALWTCSEVKQTHYRTGRPWGFQEVEVPRFKNNRHMKVVRLSALCTGRLYPQEIFLVLISVRGWVNPTAIVRPEVLCQWKIPMTPSGIAPATFWLVT
jgi:hypothetical protein